MSRAARVDVVVPTGSPLTLAARRAQPLSDALNQRLGPYSPPLAIEQVDVCDSTNTRLSERARAGDYSPCLLVAREQTAGRGRAGRGWLGVPGQALTFSLGLPMAPREWSGLSVAVGVALAEALSASVGNQVQVKWPNDLWVDGRKLAGILVETVGTAAPNLRSLRYVVTGVGINIQAPVVPDARNAPVGLADLLPGCTPGRALECVAGPLLDALLAFERDGFAPWQPRFAACDALADVPVQLSDGTQGVACGVGPDGALRLRTAAGMTDVTAGDVSVRPR